MSATSGSVRDLDRRFDENYLYFYEAVMTPERNEREADLITRLLDLTPGLDVLVVPCGFGRIANRLAARGCRVTGLDASPLYLERARRDAADLGAAVEYVEGDMRQLPWKARFDRVGCWFISFGYFDDETNRAVLAGFRRALRPGGRLLIDHTNLTSFARRLPPSGGPMASITSERGDDLMMFRQRYDVATGRIELERLVVRDGRTDRHRFSYRAFTFAELRDWLLQAGFSRVEPHGSDGGPLTLESGGMIAVAHV